MPKPPKYDKTRFKVFSSTKTQECLEMLYFIIYMKDTAAVPSWFLDSFCIINISLTSVLWRSRAVPFHSICTHFYAIWKCHIVRSLQCLASKFHSMSNECESSMPPPFMIYFLKREVLEQPSTRYSIFNICRYLKKIIIVMQLWS